MTEDEARQWFAGRVNDTQMARLNCYSAMLVRESDSQNLIARSTIHQMWSRHLADSAQLVDHVGAQREGLWVDIGSGAGLPGIVVAAISTWNVVLIEPRRLRIDFLKACVDALELTDRVAVIASRVETAQIRAPAGVISARAVATASKLFASAGHLYDKHTQWVLPKGRSAESEVAEARRSWHGRFHVKQSLVDPTSGIIVAQGISPR